MLTRLELKVPPVLVAALVALAMGLTAWLMAGHSPWPHLVQRLRPGILLPALGLVALGLCIGLSGLGRFRRQATSAHPLRLDGATQLVTQGIYQHTRNPMYLGLLLMLTGWAALLGEPWSLLGLPAYVAWMTRLQIIPEERFLAQRFGQEYARYRERVRRWC